MGKLLTMTDGFGKVRKIGYLTGETLRMWRKEEHYFRIHDGWGFDMDAFNQYNEIKFFIVKVRNGDRYIATRDAFKNHSKKVQHPGHGEQLVLPIQYWTAFKE